MKSVTAVIVTIGLAVSQVGIAASGKHASLTPVLIELFTSEGCSSCPPADELVQKLDAAQPVPDAQLIVLSEHVDYFNHDGWEDPYSSHLFTERQFGYVHTLKLSNAYTPMILVDGEYQIWGKAPQEMDKLVRQATAMPTIPIRISSVTIDRQHPQNPVLRAHIEVDGTRATKEADVYAVVALNHAESNVFRGENRGQHLTHVAVVKVLQKVGKFEKGRLSSSNIAIKLTHDVASKRLRLVVFVQDPGFGKVLGAALQKGIS